jgi:hypothetical protein
MHAAPLSTVCDRTMSALIVDLPGGGALVASVQWDITLPHSRYCRSQAWNSASLQGSESS